MCNVTSLGILYAISEWRNWSSPNHLRNSEVQGLPWQSTGWNYILPLHGSWVQSLVRELRSYMQLGAAETKQNKKRKQWSPILYFVLESVQFSSVTQLYLTLCDPMDYSTLGLPVHHQFLEFTQTDVHWVSDAIQPSHPLSSPYPPAFNLSQHQGLFQWVGSLHQVARGLKHQLQHQSFQWIFRVDLL